MPPYCLGGNKTCLTHWKIKLAQYQHERTQDFLTCIWLKNWCFQILVVEIIEGLLDCKEIKPVSPKRSQPWIFTGKTDAEVGSSDALAIWWEEATHWKRPWCWERLRAGSEGDDRGLDIWMASLTQWTWIWANCGRLWQPMKSQGVWYDLVTKQ